MSCAPATRSSRRESSGNADVNRASSRHMKRKLEASEEKETKATVRRCQTSGCKDTIPKCFAEVTEKYWFTKKWKRDETFEIKLYWITLFCFQMCWWRTYFQMVPYVNWRPLLQRMFWIFLQIVSCSSFLQCLFHSVFFSFLVENCQFFFHLFLVDFFPTSHIQVLLHLIVWFIFYRHKNGYNKYMNWRSKWAANSKSEATIKRFMADQVMPFWIQCTKSDCRKWRVLPHHVDITYELVQNYTCTMYAKNVSVSCWHY